MSAVGDRGSRDTRGRSNETERVRSARTGYDGRVTTDATAGFVRVRGANEHNLRNVDVDIPRNAMVAFTGISGSGKSSLAFGTLYAEAQRRYFESVAPYARRLLQQVGAPHVQEVTGLPPAVALQQRRGAATSRSSVGTLTTLSNLLRILYSRAGDYPAGADHLPAEAFSPNTAAGACPRCHGLGVVHDVTEELLVPDPSLSIREGAIAAWPGAWQGANLRSIVAGLGIDIDIDKPWRRLRKKDRDWLLFADEQPSVLIEPELDRVDYGYYGKFWRASTSCTSWPTPRASGCASEPCGSSRTRRAPSATAAGCDRKPSR